MYLHKSDKKLSPFIEENLIGYACKRVFFPIFTNWKLKTLFILVEMSQDSNRIINSGNKQCNYELRTKSEIITVLAVFKGFLATVSRTRAHTLHYNIDF